VTTLAQNIYASLKRIKPLRVAIRALRNTFARHRVDIWILTGEERVSGQPITVFFSGQIENCNYIASLVFHEGKFKTSHRKMWSWRVWRMLDTTNLPYSLIWIQTNQVPRFLTDRPGCFVIPSWIAGEIVVSQTLERCKKSDSIKTDLRHIKQHRFEYKVTRDHEEIERFYSTMYLPYVRQTHGNRAFVSTLDELKREAGTAELLFVEQDGKQLAGIYLGNRKHDCIDALELGVTEGDHSLVKIGVLSAIYYYTILHAAQRGIAKVYLGGVRPFLKDGTLQYKKKWGLHITGKLHTLPDLIVFQPRLGSAAVKSYLKNNPFVYEEQGTFRAAVFLDAGQDLPVTGETASKLCKAYCLPGLDGLSAFRVDREMGSEVVRQVTSFPANRTGTVAKRVV
jgi:hypothetical protein